MAENAVPLSEKVILPSGPASRVVEVNTRTAARIGLRAGDLVELSPLAGSKE